MFDQSSRSKVDDPLIQRTNLLTPNMNGNENDAEQSLGILANREAEEDEIDGPVGKPEDKPENRTVDEPVCEPVVKPVDETLCVVYQNRNTTFNRSQQRKNTDILDSAEVKDIEWTKRCFF